MGARAFANFFLTAAAALLLAACQSPRKNVTGIRLGMTKEELVQTIGEPAETVGPVRGRGDRAEEIWLYELQRDVETGRDVTVGVLTGGAGFFEDPTKGRRYGFVFVDNQLVRWGAGVGQPAAPR